MIDDIISQAKGKMQKSIDATSSELAKVRAGRAHPSVLDHIMVDYYGQPTPLSQVASISVEDSRTLSVIPYEKTIVDNIEKAIMKSSMGLNPNTAGTSIRVPLPPLTEERRKDLVKLVHKISENSRVGIRAARRDANQLIKQQLKDKQVSEDEQRKSESDIQEITNSFIKQIDELVAIKENDLMQV